jgi:hypothetical protein
MSSNDELSSRPYIKTETIDLNDSTELFVNLKVHDYVKYMNPNIN